MTRLYGRRPTPERVPPAASHGHGKTTTVVAAFRLGGLFAPIVVDGALNGDLFAACARRHLAPRLRPGDIPILDSLRTHKVRAAVDAIHAVGARVLDLPPYSPDPSPIGRVFAKVENELRRRELRTVPELEHAFGESPDWIPPTDALHYSRSSGYALRMLG